MAAPDTETIINEPRPGFMGHLAHCFQCYPYKGRRQFLIDFELERHSCQTDPDKHFREWFLLTGVDNHIFASDFVDPPDQNTPWTSWSSYDTHLQTLLVRMTKSKAHETASMTFQKILFEALQPTGLLRHLKEFGSATHYASLGGKEPDLSWRPSRVPRGRSSYWPSAVLEVADTESEPKLSSDIRFWKRASRGDVKSVITLRVDRAHPQIRIENWVNSEHNKERPHLRQSVTIHKDSKNRITSNGPFVISFEDLILREAQTAQEKDISLDEDKLHYLAGEIWQEQGF